jgi:hypothetical protein
MIIKIKHNNTPISGIIPSVKLYSGTKNPYFIIFNKTDELGVTKLSYDEIYGQFLDHHEVGLMDYNGSIDKIISASINILDLSDFKKNLRSINAWPLLKHEKTNWDDRKKKSNYILSSNNELYKMNDCIVDKINFNFEYTIDVYRIDAGRLK